MNPAAAHLIVDRLASSDVAESNLADMHSLLRSAQRLRSWIDSRVVAINSAIAAQSSFPEKAIAASLRTSINDVQRQLQRAKLLDERPSLADALASGDLTSEQVDHIGSEARMLSTAAERDRFHDLVADIVSDSSLDLETFRRSVCHARQQATADQGESVLQRQRRAQRLSTWTDREGMFCVRGRFDPATGSKLSQRLEAEADACRAVGLSPECPTDPLERQGWLRAEALGRLILGVGVARIGRPELVIVRDERTSNGYGQPTVDIGVDGDVPAATLDELLHDARTFRVTITLDGEILAPGGELNQGRNSRLPTAHQRRVLRALYPTCAISGCNVRHNHLKAHHIIFWRNGGTTDLCNLVPLCNRHHHAVHDQGWKLELDAFRNLTLTLPDGTVQTTGPPSRGIAA